MDLEKKPDKGSFIGIAGVVAAIFIPILQANGVDVNWQTSLLLYIVLVCVCSWSLQSHAIPYWTTAKRIITGVALVVALGGLGAYATRKQYLREHTETRQAPSIAWSNPDPVVAGTPLSDMQLNAKASVEGSFNYNPKAGFILRDAIQYTLSATFYPSDKSKYETASKTVYIVVNPAPPKPLPVPSSKPAIRPYDLPNDRRDELVTLLKPPVGASSLRVGCLSWSERACAVAGQFIILLSQAGWAIDENRVFRMDAPIPTEGVSIVSLPEPGPPQPPHLGRWHKMNISELYLMEAFAAVGLKYNTSSDASLRNDVTGVYFGLEPSEPLTVNKPVLLNLQAMKYSYQISTIDQQKPNTAAKDQEESQWNDDVEHWLRLNFGEKSVLNFRRLSDLHAKEIYLASIGLPKPAR